MAIRYDDRYIKRPNTELEYTDEMVEELIKCRDDVLYFTKNYVKIITLDHGEVLFDPYSYQIDTLNLLANNRFFIGLWARQSGKTTIVANYALWYSIFNENKNIGIVSNKESSAKRILDNIKKMYEGLPTWLKPGVTEYAKTSITFDNGTKILISATTQDAFRGWPMNIVICDEFAFVPSNAAEEFWASNYPTISSSTKSRIIIISTPNGMFNIFHRLWVGANTEGEAGNSFVPQKVTWEKVPGRDKTWAKEQIKNLGIHGFNQEFACVSGNTKVTVKNPDTNEMLNVTMENVFDILMAEIDNLIWGDH